jgi:hypothetical protein
MEIQRILVGKHLEGQLGDGEVQRIILELKVTLGKWVARRMELSQDRV